MFGLPNTFVFSKLLFLLEMSFEDSVDSLVRMLSMGSFLDGWLAYIAPLIDGPLLPFLAYFSFYRAFSSSSLAVGPPSLSSLG